MINIKILTAYPEMFPGTLGLSLMGRALRDKKFSMDIINLHDFGISQRKNIDDIPFGGGPGMVIRPDVIEKAILSININPKLLSHRIYLTPAGKSLNQEKLGKMAKFDELIILCGRFEGVDKRAIDVLNFEEISIGDYVLSGGEIAAQVLVEGCIRLLPGVLGHSKSVIEESFYNNLLEYPQYTKPKVWKDAQNKEHHVPDILLSGHHGKIKEWRTNKSIEITKKRRPDLLEKNARIKK